MTKTEKVALVCQQCGSGFTPRPSTVHRAKYCSVRCYRNARHRVVVLESLTEVTDAEWERFCRLFRVIDGPIGCWQWTGATMTGYGRFSLRGRSLGAHRISYVRHHGEIPPGLPLDHLCRNPGCVNPAHLEPVTYGENLRRGIAMARKKELAARRTACGRGHLWSANTYIRRNGGRVCAACAKLAKERFAARRKAVAA